MHPATESLYSLLRVSDNSDAQAFSFHEAARKLVAACDDSPELSAALRHLLNARSFVGQYMGPETPGQCMAMLRVFQCAAAWADQSGQPEARAIRESIARLAAALALLEQDGLSLMFAYGQLFLAKQAALRCLRAPETESEG
ncbi:MAG: hypothetical protein VYA51_12930 [Planctomycetota bacterium]|nr:hypothetical protein [Planctomycetota bacterium]